MNVSLTTTSRSRILLILLFGIGAIFVIRLFYVQIIQHDYYEKVGLLEHTSKFTIAPKRGVIYAKNGTGQPAPLVLNEPAYLVYADPRFTTNTDKITEVLRRVAGGNTTEHFDSLLRDKSKQYVVLAKQLNQKQADLIKKEKLAGVGLQQKDRRVYPEGSLAAQLLGYVNNDGEGQYGIEGKLDERLAGEAGLLRAVTDVNGIPLSISTKDVSVLPRNGDNLLLNIDRNIQNHVEQALKTGLERVKATQGSVIVMDPSTGAVLAMASYPTYDPAKYFEVNDYGAFQNKVVSDPYEAGSVMKTLTMGVGLDKGVIKPDTTYNNTGSTRVADVTIKNAIQSDSIGPTTMTQVLQYSLNTGVVHVLRQLSGGDRTEITKHGRDILYDYFANHYMFDKKTNIEQVGETKGKIISPDDEDGGAVRYSNMTFGQGMNVTMIQVASAFSAAVNGGTYYQPQLVGGTIGDDGKITPKPPKVVKSNVLSPTASKDLQNMAVEARQKGIVGKNDKPGYRMGGKTGTSQIIDTKTGKYTDNDSTGSYLGFGGDDTPRYVIMVRVIDSKAAGYAGTVAAAPIFADVSNWLLDYMQIQPKL